ncbi:MAG: FHA domain-containing protein [Paracoccaceae bacterium]
MKFIRDIINEKKQTAPQSEALRTAPRAVEEEPLILEQASTPEPETPSEPEEHFSLFDDGNVIEGSAEPVESLFGEDRPIEQPVAAETAPMPRVERPARPIESPAPTAQPAAAAAPTASVQMDEDLTQHILSRSEAAEPQPEPVGMDPSQPIEVPAPAAGRASRRAGRVKTRLLGFGSAQETVSDPMAATPNPSASDAGRFPVGWLVVADGPGHGAAFTLFEGVSQIGRGEDQAVRLDFGDTSISRSNHAAVAYDAEQKAFYLGHGGKANLVRLNGRPVLSTEVISSGDQIRIGETSLRFVALCGAEFDWTMGADEGEQRVSYA